MRRIAAMAEAYDTALAPHRPLGPIALAACLQVGFAGHRWRNPVWRRDDGSLAEW